MNVMRKYAALIAILVIASITTMGCQAFSNGIAKKTSCCDKVIKCTGNDSANDSDETADATNTTAGSADDLLHSLPFSTIAL